MATDPSSLIQSLVGAPGLLGPQSVQNANALAERQATQVATQQAQANLNRDAQYQADVENYLANQSPENLAALVAKYPDKYEALQQSHKVLSDRQQAAIQTGLANLYGAAQNEAPDLVADHLDRIIQAEDDEGMDTYEGKQIAANLRSSDPATVKAALKRVENFSAAHLSYMNPKFATALGIGQDTEGHYKSSPLGIFDDHTGGIVHPISDKTQYRVVRNADGSTTVLQLGGSGDASAASGAADMAAQEATAGNAGASGQPLSIRLNNPGAIRYDPKNQWQGQVGNSGGFVQFDSVANGERAHRLLIANQIREGYDTPLAWAQHYAPTSDGNDPQAYAQRIAQGLGIGINDKMPMSAVPKIASLSAGVEAGGTPVQSGAAVPSTASGTPTAIVGSSGSTQPGVKVVYSTPAPKVGVDAGTVEFYAQKVAAGGDMPQLGSGKQAAALKQAIYARSAQIQQGQGMTGGDSNLLHADVKTATMALGNLQKTRNSLDPFLQTFDGASAQLRALAPKAVGGSIPIFNRWIQAGRQSVAGDPVVSRFNVLVNTVANENAKIMSGASGGAVTSDSARHEAMTLINNAMTLDQLNAVLDQMHTDTTIRLRSMDDRATDLRRVIAGRGPGSPPSPAPAQPQPHQVAKAPPPVGTVARGYKFRGGNPADRNNWIKVQ